MTEEDDYEHIVGDKKANGNERGGGERERKEGWRNGTEEDRGQGTRHDDEEEVGAGEEHRRRRRHRSYSGERRRRRSRSESRDRRRRRYRERGDDSRERSRRRDGRGYRDRDDGRRYRRDEERAGARDEGDEAMQLDRTMRTVQVYNLNLKADERDLFQFFSKAGPLVDIKIIKDKGTGRSKGFAYVEYEKKESVVPALALTGQMLMGQAVMVKVSEAEKNVAWQAAQAAKRQAAMEAKNPDLVGPPQARVKLTNVHPSLNEEVLKPIFEPFGSVSRVVLERDEQGRSVGRAYVQFTTRDDALKAVQELEDKIDIQGKVMRLEMDAGGLTNAGFNAVDERLDVDADDGGGLRLSAQSRVALMSRLAANAGIEMPSMPTLGKSAAPQQPVDELELEQGVLGPASPIPTQCVLLKNAFNPMEESEPDWDQDIAADMKEECSKFGHVLFVHVDRKSKVSDFCPTGTCLRLQMHEYKYLCSFETKLWICVAVGFCVYEVW